VCGGAIAGRRPTASTRAQSGGNEMECGAIGRLIKRALAECPLFGLSGRDR
jgi:hypothetical protein